MSDDEVPVKTRKVSDKQMAGLRKGMEALKAKREALAKEREEFEEKKTKGEVPADAPRPKMTANPKPPKIVKVSAPPPAPVEVIQVERKKREVKPKNEDVKNELIALRAELASLKKPAEIVEKVVEKPIDRIVEKNKVVSASELLNNIFFK